MGNFYTNIALRPSNQDRVVETLKRLRRRAYVSPTRNRFTIVYDSKSEGQDTKILCDLALRLSKELKCAAWGVLNHDDDVLWYVLCSKGKVVDWYNSDPLYFEESDEPSIPEGGDGKRLAQLMGTRPSIDKLTKFLMRTDDSYFALDRHRDLAKAIGVNPRWITAGFNVFESGSRVIAGTSRVGGQARLPSVKRRGTQSPGGEVDCEHPTWYSMAMLDVLSGGIDVVDLGAVPSESTRVRVPNGTYAVEARLIESGGGLCVSRVRARQVDSMVKLGPQCGQVPVDFGAVAIGDFQPMRRSFKSTEQMKLNKWATRLMSVPLCEKHTTRIGNTPVNLVACKSGFGDGTYPAFLLNSKGRPAGIEIEFVKDGEAVPSAPDADWVRFKRVRSKVQPTE